MNKFRSDTDGVPPQSGGLDDGTGGASVGDARSEDNMTKTEEKSNRPPRGGRRHTAPPRLRLPAPSSDSEMQDRSLGTAKPGNSPVARSRSESSSDDVLSCGS